MAEGRHNRLRELRDRRGWSIRDLAERTRIDFNALSRMERDAQAMDTTRMRVIAKALDVKMSELLNDEDVEFRADERSMELLSELNEVPATERTALLVASRELMRVARGLAAQASAAALGGESRQVGQLADIWNSFDHGKRQRALDLLRASGLVD